MATGGSPLSSLAAIPPTGSTTTSAFSDHSVSPSGLTDSRFRQCFNEMRESGEMCDVQIVVEDSSFAAHKLILAGCSPYFRGMFRQGNFDESKSNRIPIDPKGDLGIRAEAVEQLIIYMYTGRVTISQQNVIDLIRAADLLELTSVKNETLKVIEEHISFDTYLDIRQVGTVFNCPRLLEAVDRFIRKNFTEFIRTQAFYELSENELVHYLDHNHLRTETEEVIYDAALEWCKRRGLLAHFPNVAQSVRFNLISIKHLLKSLRDDVDVRSQPEVTNYLLDRMQSMAGSLHAAISRPRFSTQVLIAMPYRSKSFYMITFYGGDHIEFSIKQFPDMIHEHIDALINYNVCRIGNTGCLFMAGGTGYNANNEIFHSDRCFVYDVIRDTWCSAQNLPHDSNTFGMEAVGNKVYLTTGSDGSAYISSEEVECFDPDHDHLTINANSVVQRGNPEDIESVNNVPQLPLHHLIQPQQPVQQQNGLHETRSWYPINRMNYNRSSVHMAVVGRKLYALGGMLDGGYASLVEMYDAEDDNWIEVDPMSQARCNPGIAVAGGKIYVVGGLGENLLGPPGPLKTVEYYDPESDTWTSLPDMYFARHSPAVAHVNNKLFVFGGGSPSPLLSPGPERTIECFDFERHEWFVLQAKIPGRSNAVYVSAFFDNLDT